MKPIKRFNFTLFFFKGACHANPDAVRKQARRSSYILRNKFLKISNISAQNNVLL